MSVPHAADSPSPSVPAIETGRFHIPSLDGFRAFAFLVVFLDHAGLGKIVPGRFGVTVFFFLSGYLITTFLRTEFESTHDINFKHFYLRRILRIFPPFYTVLAIGVILTLAEGLPGRVCVKAISAQAFHFGNYWMIQYGSSDLIPGSQVYWSLAVEEHFYLLFPFFYLFLRRRGASANNQAMILVVICGAALAWRCLLNFGFQASERRLSMGSDTRIDSLLFGCLLAVWGNPVLDAPVFSERRLKRIWLPLALAALLLCFILRDLRFRETLRYSIQGLAFIPIFTAAIRFPNWGAFKILNLGFVRIVGVLSYSLYLVHLLVLYALERTIAQPILRGVAAMVLSLLLASLSYRLIEKPCARLRKRLASQASPGSVPDKAGASAISRQT